jgi:hypothetical protein
MNKNAAKVIALIIVGGVAKALFREPAPITNNYYQTPEPSAELALKTDGNNG